MKTATTASDVLIVGAGPSGLIAAALLSRWGIRLRIIEANAGPNLQTRALGVQARSMEIYQQMGLEAEVFARGLPTKYAAMYTERGELGRIPMQDIGAGLSAYPYMFILPQDQNERVLGDDLKRHGLEVDWNTSLKGLENTANGVTVTLETPHGPEVTTFRYVIGADGARSAVRKALNIEFSGSTDEDHKFFVADLQAEGELTPGALCLYMSHKYHVLALFPMPGEQRFRLIGMLPDDLVKREDLTFADLQPKLREMVGGRLRFNDASWFSTYSVHHRVAVQFKKGNSFLIGDAAHVHSPVGGQGMNTGLQDAYNLAWKLALVLREQANERLLETYHDERHPNAMSLINTTDRAFSVLVSGHPLARFLIDWVVPHLGPIALKNKRLQKRFFMSFSQTGLNYRKRKLSIGQLGQVKAGDRFPWFTDNGQDVFQKMTGTRFTLFALGDWSRRKAELEALRSPLLEPIVVSNRDAYTPTGLSDGLYLVRPDGYIGYCAEQLDLEALGAYVLQTLGLKSLESRVTESADRHEHSTPRAQKKPVKQTSPSSPTSALTASPRAAMKTQRNWQLDVLLLTLFVLVCAPVATGLPVHEWLSLIFALPVVLHLLWHWNWVLGVFTRTARKLPAATQFSRVWNLLLFVLMVVASVSGILISEAALPVFGIHPVRDVFWTLVHRASANLTLIVVGVHLAVHWRWIAQRLFGLFQRAA